MIDKKIWAALVISILAILLYIIIPGSITTTTILNIDFLDLNYIPLLLVIIAFFLVISRYLDPFRKK